MNNKNTTRRPLNMIQASITFLVLLTLFTSLLYHEVVGIGSWITMLTFSFFTAFLIYFSELILSFDFKKLRVTLRDIKQTESSIKELAKVTLETVKLSDERNVQFSTPKTEDLDRRFKEVITKLENLTKDNVKS